MLHGREDFKPGPMYQHPEIGEGYIKKVTNLFQRQPLTLTQHQHTALQLWEAEQRVLKALTQFIFSEQGFRGVLMPGQGGEQPVTISGKPIIVDGAVRRR